MPKRKTKKEQTRILGKGICDIIHHGKPQGRMDGGVGTKPTVLCENVLESEVLKACMGWLKARQILCDRNNTGMGDIAGDGRKFRYGIKGAGDILGCLPNGKHFEIECKRGKGGTQSLDQQKRMKNVRANNGIYLIVHGINELERLMGELL
jgi:hypothetical protein